MCAPRFDSPPLFCRLLDAQRGGAFAVAPEGLIESRQYYEPDTAALVTEMLGPAGLVRVTDALTLRQGANLTEDAAHGRCELVRAVEALRGDVRLRIEVEPQGGAQVGPRNGCLLVHGLARPHLDFQFSSSLPLQGLRSVIELREGAGMHLTLRWGNAAAAQIQHDVYGEILDCAYQWAAHYGEIDSALWGELRRLIEAAAREWRDPDHGVWEVRTAGRPFTYSAALCQVALDRGAKMVERFKLPGEATKWRAAADEIRAAILDEAWDAKLNSLTEVWQALLTGDK